MVIYIYMYIFSKSVNKSVVIILVFVNLRLKLVDRTSRVSSRSSHLPTEGGGGGATDGDP